MADDLLKPYIQGYRSKETLPTKFDRLQLRALLEGVNAASEDPNIKLSQATRTQVSPEKLGDRILVEGRGDAGANRFDTSNKSDVALYEAIRTKLGELSEAGGDKGAIFMAAIQGAVRNSQRLNKDVNEVYNGTGTSKVGTTGKDYAARIQKMAGAIDEPKNIDLKDYISRGIKGDYTPQENVQALTDADILNTLVGKSRVDYHRNTGGLDMYREADNVISKTAKALNISGDRLKAVEKDLGEYGTGVGLINIFPSAYRKASGVDIPKEDSKTLAGFSPDTNAILNALTGIEPLK